MEPRTCAEAEPFALMVRDDSMEPEFAEGCIIIVDPTGRAADGAFVLANLGGVLTFRQLAVSGDGFVLRPLNPRYPAVPLEAIHPVVKGVITQRAGKRRRHFKRYT